VYIAGIDGGGTKTHCIIGDEKGNIISFGNGGPANYHSVGIERSRNSLKDAINEALLNSNLTIDDIDLFVFGLSGADQEDDFIVINKFIKEIIGEKKYKLYHDSWIGLRSGSEDYTGIAAICGTGTGFSGRRKDGKEVVLRNLDYRLGNKGGGDELAIEALHFAFRSEEGTFYKTELENVIPKLFSVKTMEDVSKIIKNNAVPEEILKKIPIEVFRLANEGDTISQELLIDLGETLGRFSTSVIKKLEMENEDVKVILIGSIYKGDSPLLLDAMRQTIHKVAKNVELILPDKPPVYGAYYLGIDLLSKSGGDIK
jgi:N-acetylglucosamine kinase-like BadF-type ATPase